jgi:hypothetical protein
MGAFIGKKIENTRGIPIGNCAEKDGVLHVRGRYSIEDRCWWARYVFPTLHLGP